MRILAIGLAIALPVAACAAPSNPAYVEKVFDTSKLHKIVVTVPTANLTNFKSKTAGRVKATVEFDGEVVADAGIRQAGTWRPYVNIDQKPSLSIKFNEFEKGRELFGLKKLLVKNLAQDSSLVNEHLTYEVFRRAGIIVPLTAYAQVTINGVDQGIYMIREAVNQQFLGRHFGKENNGGNLYEITFEHDPITRPGLVNLKDEVSEKRSRADIRKFSDLVTSSGPATFVRTVGTILDIDEFITVYAVEAATSHWDGYAFNVNNNYLYMNPKDGRFVFIPYGADQTWWSIPQRRIKDPMQPPIGRLAAAIRSSPELTKKLTDEIKRVGGAAVWDKAALLARVAEVEKVLKTADMRGRAASDFNRFKAQRSLVETFIKGSGTTNGTGYLKGL